MKARTVSRRRGVAVRIAAFAFVDSSRRHDKSTSDRYIGKTTLPSNGHADDAQGRSARAKFVQMFAELQAARCEMEKRVSLNDRPIMMNRHVPYVGRQIRHECVENVVLK